MLVLKRKERQWVEITHRESGDVMRIRVIDIDWRRCPPTANLVFDDDDRNFNVVRPEAREKAEAEAKARIGA